MPAHHKYLRSVLLLSTAIGLSACSNDLADLESYAAEVRARKSTKIEPIPEITPYEAFLYVEAGRRDPFVSLNYATPQQDVTGGIQPDFARPKEPLEEFPLDSIVMVGTISAAGSLYAMVRAGDGVIHRVTMGNHLGQNYGRIDGISESEIYLTEIIPDGFGGFMEQEATISMSRE